jgi:hypothetical protein
MPLAYISEISARNFKSNAGIYVISKHPPTKKGVRLVKIGRSIDVRKRLNDYHICFPQGFEIWMVIKLSDKTRELAKPQRIEVTKVLEKRLFAELIHMNLVHPSRRFHEYFVIKSKQDFESLKEAVERIALNYRPFTVFPPITEWKKGTQYNEFEIDGEQVTV